MKGILIAFEGIDGSGKSTQAKLVYQWLRSKGLPVHQTEWNSSPLVRDATKFGKETKRLIPHTFHLIHAADFADRWARQIEPVLEVGGVVICDRYFYTSMARDGARGLSQNIITNTYSFARKPDITLYFDVPVEVALQRILDGRPELKYYEAGLDMQWTFDPLESYRILQTKIKTIYSDLVNSGQMISLDATKSVSEIQKQVRGIINEKIDFQGIEPVYLEDRLAEQSRGARLEWVGALENEDSD